MAKEYQLSFTAEEIDERLSIVGSTILSTPQALTKEQQAQARTNIGVVSATEVADIINAKLSSITNAEEVAY